MSSESDGQGQGSYSPAFKTIMASMDGANFQMEVTRGQGEPHPKRNDSRTSLLERLWARAKRLSAIVLGF